MRRQNVKMNFIMNGISKTIFALCVAKLVAVARQQNLPMHT